MGENGKGGKRRPQFCLDTYSELRSDSTALSSSNCNRHPKILNGNVTIPRQLKHQLRLAVNFDLSEATVSGRDMGTDGTEAPAQDISARKPTMKADPR